VFAAFASRVCANDVDAASITVSAQVTENRTVMTPAPSAATRVGRQALSL
jgi:hypothetical protein